MDYLGLSRYDFTSIFVATSGFNEDDLEETVASAYQNADIPVRVYFGIVEQRSDGRFANLARFENVKKINLAFCEPWQQPAGLGFGRLGALMLHENQDYLLQIDAHTIFAQGWDSSLIADIEKLQQYVPRSFLSARPWCYLRESDGSIRYVSETTWAGLTITGGPPGYNIDGLESPRGKAVGGQFYEHYLVSGGFIFAPLSMFAEIMPDPRIAFGGEEHVFALRACTRDWRVFSAPECHLWSLSKSRHDYNNSTASDFERQTRPWKSFPPKVISTRRPCIDFQSYYDDVDGVVGKVLKGQMFGYWGAPNEVKYEEYIRNLGFDYRLP